MARPKKVKNGDYFKAFPSVLRGLIKDYRITQQTLADYLEKSRQAISCYCDGSSSPDWETLVKIAKFFSVSTDYLVGETSTKSPKTEIQAICKLTGLSETSILNLHKESKNAAAIFALDKVLSNDYEDLHRLNLQVYKALMSNSKYPFGSTGRHPLTDFIPEDKRAEFFGYLEKWGGETLDPKEARDYYASQAAHIFQRMVENAGYNAKHINIDEL